jgi:hypothetical protein
MRRGLRRAAFAAPMVAVVVAAAVAAALGASPSKAARPAASSSSSCHLANGIQHVIEITFDNVHYNRDNPNVLSDLEQMPALTNFITSNGTMLSNNHTPMIGHTADDILTNLSGLYGDRQGQGLTNSYETYNSNGTVTSKASFAYWTSTYGLDAYPNQPYSANVPAAGAPPKTPPAPWVPFTRAGCDFGGVSTANMELENVNPDIPNFFGPNSPETQQLNADSDSFKDQEVADYVGLGVHCAQGSSFCADAQAVKYGQSSPSNTAVTDSLPDEPGGYVGFQALFGHKYLQPQLKGAANSGDNRVFSNGDSFPVYDSNGNLTDLTGKEMDGAFLPPGDAGFPGFGGISAAQSLAYVADMQETGVPITYAYISDAHEKKSGQSGCSNGGTAQGPGDTCYQQTLASYNSAFATFFKRLADDGINKSNTLFVFAADEGDHFSGANVDRAVTPTCTGTPDTTGYTCSYGAGTIGEQQVSIHGLLADEFGDTTPFYNEPQGNAVFINGQPSPTSPVTRTLERDFGNAQAYDSFDQKTESVAQYEADPEVEQLLHILGADPARTPSFTVFPRPDFYLSTGYGDPTSKPNTPNCPGATAAAAPASCTVVNNGFAWNHGYYAPEIDNTWLGLVGPGVANKGVDGFTAAEGPSSEDGSNSNPKPVTAVQNPGTWADHTDIRPTILALTGLKDDYIDDGRVLVEDLTVSPGKTGQPKFDRLAACYKQLNASVGAFGTDVLVADSKALKTGSGTDDSSYLSTLAKITSLGAARDALATKIKGDLYDAEFNDHPIPGANDLKDCQDLLAQADALAAEG